MLKSMTGYGRDRQNLSGKDITVEIKAVNNRFLERTGLHNSEFLLLYYWFWA